MQAVLESQAVHLGDGSLHEVAPILERLSARKVFLVADEPACTASGAADELKPQLAGRSVERFTGFEPNPKLEDIQRGIQQFRCSNSDVVMAVGGGTAIDLAKLIGTLGVHDSPAEGFIAGHRLIEKKGPPLIAIPTTAGTGSEATHFAVAYMDGRKYSVTDSRLLPDFAVVDPRLTHSLPANITAASGLDAFCQSVESIWAVGATDESIDDASESVRLAIEHLPTCVHQPTPEARAAMCRAAHLSGKAINVSKTTASHAISYAITSRFGVPHGMAVALTLGQMLRFNASVNLADCTDPRGADHVQARLTRLLELLDVPTAEKGADRIRSLMDSVGAPLRLREVGVQSGEEISWLASQTNAERLSNNPKAMTTRDIEKILEKIW